MLAPSSRALVALLHSPLHAINLLEWTHLRGQQPILVLLGDFLDPSGLSRDQTLEVLRRHGAIDVRDYGDVGYGGARVPDRAAGIERTVRLVADTVPGEFDLYVGNYLATLSWGIAAHFGLDRDRLIVGDDGVQTTLIDRTIEPGDDRPAHDLYNWDLDAALRPSAAVTFFTSHEGNFKPGPADVLVHNDYAFLKSRYADLPVDPTKVVVLGNDHDREHVGYPPELAEAIAFAEVDFARSGDAGVSVEYAAHRIERPDKLAHLSEVCVVTRPAIPYELVPIEQGHLPGMFISTRSSLLDHLSLLTAGRSRLVALRVPPYGMPPRERGLFDGSHRSFRDPGREHPITVLHTPLHLRLIGEAQHEAEDAELAGLVDGPGRDWAVPEPAWLRDTLGLDDDAIGRIAASGFNVALHRAANPALRDLGYRELILDWLERGGSTPGDDPAASLLGGTAAEPEPEPADDDVLMHGHGMLMARALVALARFAEGPAVVPEPLTMIEVGSTRENLPGQGSTAVLAQFALKQGVHFVTVDMDPENTEQAAITLAGSGFEAVNAKGEDYLRSGSDPIHFLYLDAFDYWHPHHSARRYEKYAAHLGTTITDEGAAQMHLECAEAVVDRMVPGGVIVIDDTFYRDRQWSGKGATAVPFLLSRNYILDDLDENSVALVRVAPAAADPHRDQ